MKDFILKNIAQIEPEVHEEKDNVFFLKKAFPREDTSDCSVMFVEVPVGQHSFGYHYHDQSEEVFYIISGEGTLRTFYGEKAVKAGDVLCFPTGEKGAHCLSNRSEIEPLVYIDFGTRGRTDIISHPDEGFADVLGAHTRTRTELPKQK